MRGLLLLCHIALSEPRVIERRACVIAYSSENACRTCTGHCLTELAYKRIKAVRCAFFSSARYVFVIVRDIRNKCPDLHNKEGLTGPGEERENEKYIRITHSRSEFNDEHCYVYNKSKEYSCGAYLFLPYFLISLPINGKSSTIGKYVHTVTSA